MRYTFSVPSGCVLPLSEQKKKIQLSAKFMRITRLQLSPVVFAALSRHCQFVGTRPQVYCVVRLAEVRHFSIMAVKKNGPLSATQKACVRSVVGPDYMTLLTGKVSGRSVSLYLCGESHEEAIDVTRKGGKFLSQEGWIPISECIPAESPYLRLHDFRILKSKKKAVPLSAAKDFGTEYAEYDFDPENGTSLFLLFSESESSVPRKKKGLVWIVSAKENKDGRELERTSSESVNLALEAILSGNAPPTGLQAFHWNDTDEEARTLNQRRLREACADDSIPDHDALISRRSERLKKNDIWTWDAWLEDTFFDEEKNPRSSFHLILEEPVVPWELEMYEFSAAPEVVPAPDFLREDSDSDESEDDDPAGDGGSYAEFVARKMFEKALRDSTKTWLHAVDARDVGLAFPKSGFLSDFAKEQVLPISDGNHLVPTEALLPRHSGETEAVKLGRRVYSPSEDDLRSLEVFFAQVTDILLYYPQLKTRYAPFLATCVGSYEIWEIFFKTLFLGGSIKDAINLLTLTAPSLPFLHVRSELRESGQVSTLFMSLKHFLIAKGSVLEPATWSSQMFKRLSEMGDEGARLAEEVRNWVLDRIKFAAADPKNAASADNFEVYLRAVHRHIYDAIDTSDPEVLRHSKFMRNEDRSEDRSGAKQLRFDVGSIKVPSLGGSDRSPLLFSKENMLGTETEILAKLLVDMWVSSLVDFCAALRILQIALKESNSEDPSPQLSVVVYMGSEHTKALKEFFMERLDFRVRHSVGKEDWDEEEARKLKLPAEFWKGDTT